MDELTDHRGIVHETVQKTGLQRRVHRFFSIVEDQQPENSQGQKTEKVSFSPAKTILSLVLNFKIEILFIRIEIGEKDGHMIQESRKYKYKGPL